MAGVETRTVQYTVAPALAAYVAWLDATGQRFDLHDLDPFIAGYRARLAAEEQEANDAEASTADRFGARDGGH